MELRKQLEKNHYNKQAENIFKKHYSSFDWQSGSKRFGPILGIPFRFTEEKIKNLINNKREQGEKTSLLDWGCGTGIHAIFPAKQGAKVYGIDISKKSIKFAKIWAKHEKVDKQTTFSVMDCENLEFPDDFFDIIFNCGTLSCVDRNKAYPEIIRVLKPNGYFISIDTLGHNPFINLKRRLKMKKGLRTQHTVKNILKIKDVIIAKKYFKKIQIEYFNILTPLAIPFCKLPHFNSILNFLQAIDTKISKSFLKRFAFKVVFIFKEPKNKDT